MKDDQRGVPVLPKDMLDLLNLIERNLDDGEDAVARGEYTERHRLFFREQVLALFGMKDTLDNRRKTRSGRKKIYAKVVRVKIVDGLLPERLFALLDCLTRGQVIATHGDPRVSRTFDILPPKTVDRRVRRGWAFDLAQWLREKGFEATMENEVTQKDIEKMLQRHLKQRMK